LGSGRILKGETMEWLRRALHGSRFDFFRPGWWALHLWALSTVFWVGYNLGARARDVNAAITLITQSMREGSVEDERSDCEVRG